jgi:fumarate reductase subunit D
MGKRKIEWNIFITIAVLLMLWLAFGLPFFNNVSRSISPAIAFFGFIGLLGVLGYLIGSSAHRGLESAMVSMSTVLFVSILFPSTVLDYNTIPSKEVLSIWGADTAVYSLWSIFNWGHQVTYVFTYFFTPLFCLLIMLYYLSGKKLKNQLWLIINGS